jgi:GH24 family phage-related lysozyme (muramidase)
MENYGPFTLTPDLLERLKPHFEDQEGRESVIYPDSEGNPTTGIGHLLAHVEDAIKLPFRLPDGKLATQAEIKSAWYRVRTTGRRVQNVLLAEKDIDSLFLQDLKRFTTLLFRNFGTLVDIPQPAVIALYDMAFNLGGFYEFPRLRMAVLAEDWNLAAEECHRLGIGSRRNTLTRALFLQAVKPPATQRA